MLTLTSTHRKTIRHLVTSRSRRKSVAETFNNTSCNTPSKRSRHYPYDCIIIDPLLQQFHDFIRQSYNCTLSAINKPWEVTKTVYIIFAELQFSNIFFDWSYLYRHWPEWLREAFFAYATLKSLKMNCNGWITKLFWGYKLLLKKHVC